MSLSLHPIFFGFYIAGCVVWRRMQAKETKRRRGVADLGETTAMLKKKG